MPVRLLHPDMRMKYQRAGPGTNQKTQILVGSQRVRLDLVTGQQQLPRVSQVPYIYCF